jgi:hypothetical protein
MFGRDLAMHRKAMAQEKEQNCWKSHENIRKPIKSCIVSSVSRTTKAE